MSEGYHTLLARSDRYRDYGDEIILITDGHVARINIALEPLFPTYSVAGTIVGEHDEKITLELKKEEDFFLSSIADSKGDCSFKGLKTVLTPSHLFHTHTPLFL